jgi:hypothetical protein
MNKNFVLYAATILAAAPAQSAEPKPEAPTPSERCTVLARSEQSGPDITSQVYTIKCPGTSATKLRVSFAQSRAAGTYGSADPDIGKRP